MSRCGVQIERRALRHRNGDGSQCKEDDADHEACVVQAEAHREVQGEREAPRQGRGEQGEDQGITTHHRCAM